MGVLFAWNQRPKDKISYESLRLATELPDTELRRTLWVSRWIYWDILYFPTTRNETRNYLEYFWLLFAFCLSTCFHLQWNRQENTCLCICYFTINVFLCKFTSRKNSFWKERKWWCDVKIFFNAIFWIVVCQFLWNFVFIFNWRETCRYIFILSLKTFSV